MNLVLPYSFAFSWCYLTFAAKKTTLEKRVKELEESLATRNAEAKKVAKDVTAREEQFVNHVAFLTQNVRGEYLLYFVFFFKSQFALLICVPCFDVMHRRLVFQRPWIRRVTRCHLTEL